MKINLKKLLIFIVVDIILFQDSFSEIIKLSIINYIDELFIVFYFLYSLFKSKGRIPKVALNLLVCTIGLFLLGIVFCLINSSYDMFSLIMSGFLIIKFFILLSAIIIKPLGDSTRESIMKSIKILGVISIITGAINFIFPDIWTHLISYTYVYKRMGLTSVMGLFIHAGQYGWFMLFVAIIYLSEYKAGMNNKGNKLFIIYSIAAILSLKVKVIISIFIIFFAYTYIVGNKKINIKQLVIFIFVGLIIISCFGDLIYNTYKQYFTVNQGDMSARYALLNGSLKIMRDYFPFGVGFGKFASYYATQSYSEYYFIYGLSNVYGLKYGNVFFGTDTFWPMIFGETGFIGTVIYISMLAYLIKNMKISIRKSRGIGKQYLYAVLGMFVFIQALVESTGEPIFNSSPQNIFIAISVGISISIIRSNYCVGEKNDSK